MALPNQTLVRGHFFAPFNISGLNRLYALAGFKWTDNVRISPSWMFIQKFHC